VAHPIRIRITFPPVTAEEIAKALRMKPSEIRAADALVEELLAGPEKPRRKKARGVGASLKSA